MGDERLAGQFVVFSIHSQVYALAIDEVVEIIRIQSITEIAGIKEYIAGVINLRGKIIPVVHLRKRFRMNLKTFDKKSRIVVVHVQGEHIGLIVDEVKMVTNIESDTVEDAPEIFNSLEQECFKGFAKTSEELIGILKLETVLYPESIEEVKVNG